jgi:membrane-bound lytic murein transglycosylase A
LAPEASINRARRIAAVLGVTVLALSVIPLTAWAARKARTSLASRSAQLPAPRVIPYPQLEWPIVVNGGQYTPLNWADIAGWASDDHVQAYKAFRVSCGSIAAQRNPPEDSKALGASLREPCRPP